MILIGVFILGAQRSGTTMLANLLVSQPNIVAASCNECCDVYKSIFFCYYVDLLNFFLKFVPFKIFWLFKKKALKKNKQILPQSMFRLLKKEL